MDISDNISWQSGPLPFARAAYVWAAAAGVAGAYFPEEFARLALQYDPPTARDGQRPCDDVGDRVPGPGTLGVLFEEAEYRADWRARMGEAFLFGLPCGRSGGSYVPPKLPILEDGALIWSTSVDTVLRYTTGGWIVEIRGVHVTRADAAQYALHGS